MSDNERPLARVVGMEDLIDALLADARERETAMAEGRPVGPITGVPVLDRTLSGFLRPGIHVVTGDPGAGKTAMALQAATGPFPALYVTAEQSPAELALKVTARMTRTPMDDLRDATVRVLRPLLTRAAESAPMLRFCDGTAGIATEAQIIEAAALLRDRFAARGVLVVVDSLQVWARGTFEGPNMEVCEAGIAALGRVATALRAPIIALSHRNRASVRERDPLSAAKGSADFEHMGESCIHLVRDAQMTGLVPVTAHIGKNRHGAQGAIPLLFDEDLQEFTER